MKIHKMMMIIAIGALALTACVGETEEGFDFSEEEAREQAAEKEMVFSEDEAMDLLPNAGFDLTGDEDAGEDPGMVFDEDEAVEPSNPPDEVFPPEDTSNWQIHHDPGTVTCPNVTIPIEASPTETVSILLGAEAASLVVSGFGGGPEIFFFLLDSGPGGSLYQGFYTPPGAIEEVKYEMMFTNLSDPSKADYLMGTIAADEQGCQVSRSFYGLRLN